jgi:hypothetical protein
MQYVVGLCSFVPSRFSGDRSVFQQPLVGGHWGNPHWGENDGASKILRTAR